MGDFFDMPHRGQMPKDETEIVDKQKHEFKLVGQMRRVPGHTTFSLNIKTGEVKVAPVERCKDVDYKTRLPLVRDRIVIEPDCVYRQALNKKNFIKRLVKEGILVKRAVRPQ